jgi:uncharacterized protein YhfF
VNDAEFAIPGELPTASWRLSSDGNAVGVIETTELRVFPAGDVDTQFARDEGESFETVADWWDAHERFWRSYAEDPECG